ncbi:MAG: hypothetical protein U0797_29190 [Gemmataceae bacterium]
MADQQSPHAFNASQRHAGIDRPDPVAQGKSESGLGRVMMERCRPNCSASRPATMPTMLAVPVRAGQHQRGAVPPALALDQLLRPLDRLPLQLLAASR